MCSPDRVSGPKGDRTTGKKARHSIVFDLEAGASDDGSSQSSKLPSNASSLSAVVPRAPKESAASAETPPRRRVFFYVFSNLKNKFWLRVRKKELEKT